MLALIATTLFTASATSADTTIYKKVDRYGNVTYTDVPPRAEEQAETIDIDSLNSYAPPAAELDTSPAAEDETASSEAPEYTAAVITSPAHDATVRENTGNITITARVEPALAGGDAMQLLMDGAPMGPPNRSGTFPLANVDRGTHQLQVRIVNDAGEVLLNGQPSVFHLQRFSALQPGARR